MTGSAGARGRPGRCLIPVGLARASQGGQYYTTQEVAAVLRVSQRTVQEWVRRGNLTAVRYGRLLRVRQSDLLAFGQELTKGAPAS